MKKLLTTITLSFTLLLILLFTFTIPALASTLPSQTNITIDKVWKIKFNKPVDLTTIQNNITLNSIDSNGNLTPFPINPSIDPTDFKTVLINHSIPFENGTNYKLNVSSNVKNSSGKSLKESVLLEFSTVAKVEPTIISISNITKMINQGDIYSLPSTVEATMSDDTKKQVNITWALSDAPVLSSIQIVKIQTTNVDSSKAGTKIYYGDVEGYSKKVKLTLIINSSTSTISTISTVNVTTNSGTAPVLPSTVTANMSDGTTKMVTVTWDTPTASQYASAGTFTVNGTIAESSTIKAIANVTVISSTTGSIKGTITWQYNKYIGTKSDVGAKIALIPKNHSKTLDDSFFALILSQIPQGKNGIYTGKADGYGYYEINDVPTGQYYLLISSAKTTSDMTIDAYTQSILSNLFSSKDWSYLQLNLKLNKYYFKSIEIRDGKMLIESHDFGYTYI